MPEFSFFLEEEFGSGTGDEPVNVHIDYTDRQLIVFVRAVGA